MKTFIYGVVLQWKLDIRSKTMLITCYLVPLLFFVFMGEVFTSVTSDFQDHLTESMTVFGVTMGALIGLPPSLVEIYSGDIKKLYTANGVPQCLGLVLVNFSSFIHLLIMSFIIYLTAPLIFHVGVPSSPPVYFAGLVVFILTSQAVASIIGLAVKDQAKVSMVSIIVFLPSIILSGIMFPAEMLPEFFLILGKLFPAYWGFELISSDVFLWHCMLPLLAVIIAASIICRFLLRSVSK